MTESLLNLLVIAQMILTAEALGTNLTGIGSFIRTESKRVVVD